VLYPYPYQFAPISDHYLTAIRGMAQAITAAPFADYILQIAGVFGLLYLKSITF
jgi:hypothetical protein